MILTIDLSELSARDQQYQAGSIIGSVHYGATAKREYIAKIMAEVQEMNQEANRGADPGKHAEALSKKIDRIDEAEEVESVLLSILRELTEVYKDHFEEDWQPKAKSSTCIDEVQQRLIAKLRQHGKLPEQEQADANDS